MRRWTSTLLVTTLAVAGLGACGSDDDSSDSTEQTDRTDAPDDDADDTTETSTPSGGGDDLSELLGRRRDAVIKVTYDDGDEGFTIAQDGDRRSVRTGDSVIITDGDRTISCDDLDAEPACSEVPEGFGDIAALGLGFLDVIADGLVQAADTLDGQTSDAEIAGRDATCVEYDAASLLGEIAEQLGESVDDDAPEGSARVCVDDESGFLLELSTEGDESDRLIATEVGAPSDADFEPPAEVQPAPDLDDLGDVNIDDLLEQQDG